MKNLLKKHLKDQRGLTLIELLAVVVILGIIAAIAIPSIGGLIQNTREDALKSDAVQVINAAKTYVASNGLGNNGTLEIDDSDLDPFVDEVSVLNYTVYVSTTSAGKTEYTISGTGNAGKKDIEFVKASVSDINAKTSTKVVITDAK